MRASSRDSPWPRKVSETGQTKLPLDPYAKAIAGRVRGHEVLFGYPLGEEHDPDLRRDRRNSAHYLPKCVVIDPTFAWEQDRPPLVAPSRVRQFCDSLRSWCMPAGYLPDAPAVSSSNHSIIIM